MTCPFGRCRRFGAAKGSVRWSGIKGAGKQYPLNSTRIDWAMGAESKLWAPAVGRLASAHRQLRTVWGVEGKPGGAPRSLLLRLNVTTPRGSKLARVCAVRMGGSAAQESIGDGWASCLLPLARADRQNQPLRIAYYSPCFEYRADLTFALSFLFCSVCPSALLCFCPEDRPVLDSPVAIAIQHKATASLPDLLSARWLLESRAPREPWAL